MPTIKKYENRRLYDSEASKYVNLDDIAAMVRRGEAVTVQDVKTGRDLTRETLLQVLLASEGGPEMLPVGMLRRVIRATGEDPLQRMLRPHVSTALELMHTQLDELEARLARSFPHLGRAPAANPFAGAFAGMPNPFAGMPNPFTAAGNPFADAGAPDLSPPPPPPGDDPPPEAPAEPAAPASAGDADLDALRRKLDELEARLKR